MEKLQCPQCKSTNVYTRLTGVVVCRRCGSQTTPVEPVPEPVPARASLAENEIAQPAQAGKK